MRRRGITKKNGADGETRTRTTIRPLPPQDSVSTNSTTSAKNFKSIIHSWHITAFDGRLSTGRHKRWHITHSLRRKHLNSRRNSIKHTAATVTIRRDIKQRNTRGEKSSDQGCGQANHKATRTRRTKYSARRTTAKSSTRIGAFTVLNKHHTDDTNGQKHVHYKNNRFH